MVYAGGPPEMLDFRALFLQILHNTRTFRFHDLP